MRAIIPGLFLLVLAPVTAGAANIEEGKKIFDQLCIHCHKSNYDEKFGPGLAGIMERRDAEWVDRFLKDPAEMIKSDEYAQTLKEGNKYDLTMPALPQMRDADKRASVIEYLKTIE